MTPFDIVLVPFPFSERATSKQRPCLVLSRTAPEQLEELYVVAMMTSQIAGLRFPQDVNVKHWETSGLPKPTLVRLSKIVTVEGSLIRKKIGRLTKPDQKTVQQNFKKLFSLLLG